MSSITRRRPGRRRKALFASMGLLVLSLLSIAVADADQRASDNARALPGDDPNDWEREQEGDEAGMQWKQRRDDAHQEWKQEHRELREHPKERGKSDADDWRRERNRDRDAMRRDYYRDHDEWKRQRDKALEDRKPELE